MNAGRVGVIDDCESLGISSFFQDVGYGSLEVDRTINF